MLANKALNLSEEGINLLIRILGRQFLMRVQINWLVGINNLKPLAAGWNREVMVWNEEYEHSGIRRWYPTTWTLEIGIRESRINGLDRN